MTLKPEHFDLLQITGLKGRKDKRDKRYATFNRRMMAVTVDSLLIMILVAPVVDYLFVAFYGPSPVDLYELRARMQMETDQEKAIAMFLETLHSSGFIQRYIINSIAQIAVMFALTAWFWRRWSATPGKMLLRIKVVDAKTELPLTDRQIFFRLLGYIISSLCLFLGIIWIGIDKRRQGWHDKMAESVVIVVPWKKTEETKEVVSPD